MKIRFRLQGRINRLKHQIRYFVRAIDRGTRIAWREIRAIARATLDVSREAQLVMIAESLTYKTLLSIVPVLAVSFAIFKAFGGLDRLYDTIEPFILNTLSQGTSDQVMKTLQGFIEQVHAGAVGAGGLLTLVWITMSMLSGAEKAINQVWQAESNRGFFQRVSSYWLFVTLGPLTASVILGFATSNNMPLSQFIPGSIGTFVLTVGVLFITYKWVPTARVSGRWAFVGASFTAMAFTAGKSLYGLYTTHAIMADRFYGSLAAFPILMVWIQILWTIILMGAALTLALQRRYD